MGKDPKRRPQDRDTEINYRRLEAMMSATEDEDHTFLLDIAAVGAPLGVGEELPRTPQVFEEKTSWARDFVDSLLEEKWSNNNESAEENAEDIERQVMKEVQQGSIVMMEEEARSQYGSRLAVAALGAVPQGLDSSAVRLIHDGSYSVDVS